MLIELVFGLADVLTYAGPQLHLFIVAEAIVPRPGSITRHYEMCISGSERGECVPGVKRIKRGDAKAEVSVGELGFGRFDSDKQGGRLNRAPVLGICTPTIPSRIDFNTILCEV